MMNQTLKIAPAWLAILVLVLASLPIVFFQSPIPIDETRYLSVAWEMWNDNSYFVPHMNGAFYSHKPPFLFWLFNAGWLVFGVNDWWPRMVSLLFAIFSLLMVYRIAGQLWPRQKQIAVSAVWILMPMGLFIGFSSAIMFDIVLLAFTLWGISALIQQVQNPTSTSWISLVGAIACAGAVKGPVALLHLSLMVIILPLFTQAKHGWGKWLWDYLLAIIFAVGILMIWLVPAVLLGGPEYTEALLWKQTAGRISNSFAHARVWWWYIPILIPLLLPWSLNTQWWRLKPRIVDQSFQLVAVWLMADFAILSLMHTKQAHYLMPLLPALALLIARVANERSIVSRNWLFALFGCSLAAVLVALELGWQPSQLTGKHFDLPDYWAITLLLLSSVSLFFVRSISKIAIASAFLILGIRLVLMQVTMASQNVEPLAKQIAIYQQQGIDVVQLRKYHDQFHFAGRLEQPINNICPDAEQWISHHPSAVVVVYSKHKPELFAGEAIAQFPYRSRYAWLWKASDFKEVLSISKQQNDKETKDYRCKNIKNYAPQ
ncbi:MAG: ArnT family glycosyltransferase [bacterium]